MPSWTGQPRSDESLTRSGTAWRRVRAVSVLLLVSLTFLAVLPVGVGHGQALKQQDPEHLLPPVSIEPWNLPSIEPLYSGCGGVDAPAINAGYEQRVVELSNAERVSRGLPPLKRVDDLSRAARYHSTDMGQDNYFNHDTYDRENGSLVFRCDTWDRILSYYDTPQGWSWMAENIAAGYATPRDVVDGWMNSPGHRNNILSDAAWEIGVGYYSGSGDWNTYWTQDFGKRNGFYPLVINDEARETNSRQVSIFIYGDWQEMRLRNDDGNWSNWQPFQSRFEWKLANGVGDHTVAAELRKPGESAVSSDSIYSTVYDPPTLGNLPDQVVFYYSISEGKLFPASRQLTPVDVTEGTPLAWQLTPQGDWFTVTPLSGSTPSSFTITPDRFNKNAEAVYTGSVVVTVTNPSQVNGSPHTILITLRVVNWLSQMFIPVIR